jgi:signal transduction histidine kinase
LGYFFKSPIFYAIKELVHTKDKFFSIIAHDLLNPFNVLLGFTEDLTINSTEYSTEEVRKAIHAIYDTSQKTYSLLKNLLEWARSQNGKIDFIPENVNLRGIVLDSITSVENQANQKKISIQSCISDKTLVFADRNLLTTILRNLLSNAVKFTPLKGKIFVNELELTDFIEISVTDTGIGISPENIQKLFKIENKQSTPGTANEKGTGLGLLLCKEFAERQSGKIWVESQINKGSTFKFTIPKQAQ